MAGEMVWMDLEMTGLNLERESIIEIATLITDGELNVDVASSVNAKGTHNYSNYSVNIDPDHRHTVAKIGWQSPFITNNVNVNVDVEYNNNYANPDSDSWSIATGVEYVF